MEKVLSLTLNDNVAESVLFYDPYQKQFACNSAMAKLLQTNIDPHTASSAQGRQPSHGRRQSNCPSTSIINPSINLTEFFDRGAGYSLQMLKQVAVKKKWLKREDDEPNADKAKRVLSLYYLLSEAVELGSEVDDENLYYKFLKTEKAVKLIVKRH